MDRVADGRGAQPLVDGVGLAAPPGEVEEEVGGAEALALGLPGPGGGRQSRLALIEDASNGLGVDALAERHHQARAR